MIFVCRVHLAIHSLSYFLRRPVPLLRRFTVEARRTQHAFTIRADASPYGFGAILLSTGMPLAYWADELRPMDEQELGLKRGDPAGQAVWEFMALVLSLPVFADVISSWPYAVLFESDNVAALSAALRMSSAKPIMNKMA
eukprot:1070420-Amphidinium_carterae.1